MEKRYILHVPAKVPRPRLRLARRSFTGSLATEHRVDRLQRLAGSLFDASRSQDTGPTQLLPHILSVSPLRAVRYPFVPVLLVCRAGELEHYLAVACSQASWRAEAEPARGQERSRAHSPRTHFSSLACCVSLRVPGARAQFERMMREELERHIESKVTLSGPRQYPS